MSPKISVIVPVYNTERYLADCLNSIVAQSLQDIEVLIVDDGSTDSSPTICDGFGQTDKRVKVYHLDNRGVSYARNFGIVHASGKYCMFVDSDDWIEDRCCEFLFEAALRTGADLIIGAHVNESSKESKTRTLFADNSYFSGESYRKNILVKTLGLTPEDLKNPSLLDRLTPVWARLYKTSVIKKYNIEFYDLRDIPSECLQFNFDFEMKAQSAYFLRTPIYHYRRNTALSVTKPYRDDLLAKWTHWSSLFREKYRTELKNADLSSSFYSRICCSVIPLGGNAVKLKNYRLVKKDCSLFLKSDLIRDAFARIDFTNCPIHWRLFFYSAKKEKLFLFILLTKMMRKILQRRKK